MRCTACGVESVADASFCDECATPLTSAVNCPSCGRSNSPKQKFCNGCGQPAISSAQRPASPDPRSYTPKHLAEKILTSRSALEGERKQVTVLFADVTGSMDLAEQVDPEEWHKIMDRSFAILSDGVHRFEGTINQYTGDGIMARFGAPIAHEKALTLVDEAIAVCRQGGYRLRELWALLTRARALREIHAVEATREIEAALAEADAWLQMSGAKSYEPFVHVERAELARLIGDEGGREREFREAHRLFLEIGAPIRATELAKELGL